jgi:hypothetical protein
MTRTLSITRCLRLVGAAAGENNPSILHFPAGVHGIDIRPSDDGTVNGARAIIEKLRVLAPVGHCDSVDSSIGILVRAPASIRDCEVAGWSGDGVFVGTPPGFPASNANVWEIYNTQIVLCRGNGLHVDGGNSQAGIAILLDVQGNCGWGVLDNSQYGNTYVACHADSNLAGAYRDTRLGSDVQGVSGSNWFGCYAEAPQAVHLGPGSSFMGGALSSVTGGSGFAGGGVRINATTLNSDDTPTLQLYTHPAQAGPHLQFLDTPGLGIIRTRIARDGQVTIGPHDATRDADTQSGSTLRARLVVHGNTASGVDDPSVGECGIRFVQSGWWAAQMRCHFDGPARYQSRLTFQTPVDGVGTEGDTMHLQTGTVRFRAVSRATRDAFPNPIEGMMVYNATDHALSIFDGARWRDVALV